MIPFDAYTAAVSQCFSTDGTTSQKFSFPRRNLPRHIILGSFAHTSQPSICSAVFCIAHKHAQQTDRHTDRPRYYICSSRPYLAIAVMRPNNTKLYSVYNPINYRVNAMTYCILLQNYYSVQNSGLWSELRCE